MSSHDPLEKTDYTRHTDAELREAIAKVEQQEPRIAQEDSGAAADAARRQREAMQAELDRRDSS
ncbi:MAG TPA: hypothetical protein VM287_05385 [Egibacteraceae bacterium]|nr:hypothetical protein [Egibacteraceae bacterium]